MCRGATVPDLVEDNCRLLIAGINPGLQTALTGIHFAHPSNRFWPAMRAAGLIDWIPNLSPTAPSVRLPTSAQALASEDVPQMSRRPLTAARQTHFCHPSNRFYPALRRAGLIDWDLDASTGLTDEQRSDLISAGIGITNLVP